MTQTQNKKPNRKKHSRRKGVSRKIVSILVSLLVAFFVLALVGFFVFQHIYKNRSEYATKYLNRLLEGYEVEFEELELAGLGGVQIKQISFKCEHQPEPILTADELVISYDFDALRNRQQVEDIHLKGPSLRLEESFFNQQVSSIKQHDHSLLKHVTGDIVIEDGQFYIDHPQVVAVQGLLSLNSGKLQFDKQGALKESIEVDISDIRIGDQGVFGKVSRLVSKLKVNQGLSLVDVEFVHLTEPDLRVVPEWFSKPKSISPSDSNKPIVDVSLAELKIDQLNFSISGFNGELVIPDISFYTEGLDWEGISFEQNRIDSEGALDLVVTNLVVGGGRSDLVKAGKAEFYTKSLGAVIHDYCLERASGDQVNVVISDDSLSLWNNPNRPKSDPSDVRFTVEELNLPNAHLTIRDFEFLSIDYPLVCTQIESTLKDLTFDSFGMHSNHLQHANMRNFRLAGPGGSEGEELIKFGSGSLSINWDQFTRNRQIETLKIDSPQVYLTDTTMARWVDPIERSELPVGPINRPVYRAKVVQIQNGSFYADSTKVFEGRLPRVRGRFDLSNDQIGQDLDEQGYQLKLNTIQLRNHDSAAKARAEVDAPTLFPADLLPKENDSEEVVKVDDLVVDFTAKGLQRNRTIKKVEVKGGTLRIGDGFKDVVSLPQESDREATKPDDLNLQIAPVLSSLVPEATLDDLPPIPELNIDPILAGGLDSYWKIEALEISEAKINLESLIPEMDGLSFGLETKLKDIPLSKAGVLDAEKLQQVRLDNIQIRDPYDSFLSVVEIPDLFVEFSFAGLSRQEIEKIDVVGPKLNVGESLFRWVDYLRKYRATNEGASVGIAGVPPVGDLDDLTSKSVPSATDWVINSINATSGQLNVAPYGTPIVSLPFPFNATTNIDEGRLKLDMLIPEEKNVYELPDYDLELTGLEGVIDFNLPLPKQSNNLVQTFTLKSAKWKKFKINEMFLTVTFDRYGIYGLFGGEAYGGYCNGAFNYYLDKNGEWDAWVAGTGLNTSEVTGELIPKGFAMGGKIDAKLFTGGKNTEVGDVTGEIATVGKGWFDIEVMEKAMQNLPENWSALQVGLSKIAVDSLKRFDYDAGSGEIDFGDKDGLLKLRFEGKYGKRNLNLHIHDWKTPISVLKHLRQQ